MDARLAQHVIELLTGFSNLHISPPVDQGMAGDPLITRSSVLELELGFGIDEIEAVAFIVDPVIVGLCAAINEPRWVCGADVVINLCDEHAIAGREYFGTEKLIFDDITTCDETVHDFVEDGLLNVACQRIDPAF